MASYVLFKVTDVGLTVFSTQSSSVKLSGLATAAAGGVLERLRRFLRALGAVFGRACITRDGTISIAEYMALCEAILSRII